MKLVETSLRAGFDTQGLFRAPANRGIANLAAARSRRKGRPVKDGPLARPCPCIIFATSALLAAPPRPRSGLRGDAPARPKAGVMDWLCRSELRVVAFGYSLALRRAAPSCKLSRVVAVKWLTAG